MKPDGFDDALQYYVTKKIPLGSWEKWAKSCHAVVETKYKFLCSWSFLVGLNVGMLKDSDTYAEFRKVQFHRATERRFSFYVLLLADMLTGTDDRTLRFCYQVKGIRAMVPRSVLYWPFDPAATERLLTSIKPVGIGLPMPRDGYADFYVNLLYGYYVTSRDTSALDKLHEHYVQFPTLLYIDVMNSDESVADYYKKKL